MCGLQIINGLIKIANRIHPNLKNIEIQIRTEKKKSQNNFKLQELIHKKDKLDQNISDIQEMIQDLFKGYFKKNFLFY